MCAMVCGVGMSDASDSSKKVSGMYLALVHGSHISKSHTLVKTNTSAVRISRSVAAFSAFLLFCSSKYVSIFHPSVRSRYMCLLR